MRAGNAPAPRVRAATPDDGAVCIPLIAEAGGRLLSWGLADAPDEACRALLQRCWDRRLHPLGARSTRVVEVDGAVVGCSVGGSARTWVQDERDHSIAIVDLVRHPRMLRRRLRSQSRARPPLDPEAGYLASLAVQASHRRLGLARLLLEDVLQHARSRGDAGVLVEVVADNAPALALYRNHGFRPLQEWRAGNGPRVLRLFAPLQPRAY